MVIIDYHVNICNYVTCSNEESEGEVNKLSLVLNKGPLNLHQDGTKVNS